MISEVYYNLRKKLFSIKQKGKVKYHNDNVVIYKAKFVVQNSGRLRVLRTKQKNVHAFVRGQFVGNVCLDFDGEMKRAFYNPYILKQFIEFDSLLEDEHKPVVEAEYAWLTMNEGYPVIKYIPYESKAHDKTSSTHLNNDR